MDTPDNSALVIAAIAAAVPPTLAAIAAFITSLRNTSKLDRVKYQLDGRLSELLAITKSAAFASGVKQEKEASSTAPAAPAAPAGLN